ncbi:hypothetical protein [Aliidiomarina soli]|uniref:DUF4785 domain-containing protein n=1 Tax=Aliidiomarina soli TaxID=1928574 RepID=A0A432WGJ7_9GAMM|nr:hypothetical protein [Aliidiomarina soli]RUO32932.1 hypothetical protein CWE14_06705 [Aliidiomarina soli]
MTPRLAVLASLLFVLAACSSEQAKVSNFQPEPGEHRRYQLVSSTEVTRLDAGGEDYSERIQKTELRSYQVTDSGSNRVNLAVQPDYLHTQADSGYSFGSVIGAMNDQDATLLEALAEGSMLQVSLDDGHITSPLSSSYTDARRSLMGSLDRLQEVLTQPGLVSGMQFKPGATRDIEDDTNSGLDGFTLRVTALYDKHVLFTIESDTDDSIQLYGRMLVERETGWLDRAGVVIKRELTADGDKHEVRSVMSLTAADWPYAELLQYNNQEGMDIDYTRLPGNLDHLIDATTQQIFPDSTGTVEVNGDRITLEYEHLLNEAEEAGQFNFTEIEAFNAQGDALELQFQALRPFSYKRTDGPLISYAEAFPLGWDGVESGLAQVDRIEATMQWFPQQLELIPIDVPTQGSTELTHGGAQARLQATDNRREFDLYLYPTPHQLFGVQVYGAESGVLHSLAIDDGADWLSDNERSKLNVIQYGEYPVRIRLSFRDQVPQQLKLVAFTIAQEPEAEQRLQFRLK